ncbi:P-selectin glycoprotein ligand 1 [Chroicocephalus ridibundus]|uniref:P-selectin glycoprotein ligand 1 n=1 Tax=Chroicocephalus ridibundus TaxID=1192867 RepID=UPI002FDDBB0E
MCEGCFPVLGYLHGPAPHPIWAHMVPGGGGAGSPGTVFAVTSAFGAVRALAHSSAEPPGEAERAPGLPQGTRRSGEGLEATFWGAGGCRQPPALSGPSPGVTSFPRRAPRNHRRSSAPAFPSLPGREAQAEGGPRRLSAFGGCPAPRPPWSPRTGAAGPLLVMPDRAAAQGPAASPGRGPMAPGWAVLVMLVLSTLWACGAVPPPELGQPHGEQWVWGAAGPAPAEPLPLSRRKRDDGGQKPGSTGTPGHGHAATMMPGSKETDSPEPDLLLGSAPPPAPAANGSLHRALVVPTTARVLDESDSPEPDLLLGSAPPPAPSTSVSLRRAFPAPTTAEPLDETDPPDPLLSSELPAAPSTDAILHRVLPTPTAADPLHETDSPSPDLLLGSAPPAEASTQAAPQKSITAVPSWLTSPSEEGTVAGGTDNSTSALGPTTTGYKKVRKAGDPPAVTHSAPWDTKPRGTAVPWDPMRVMNKCLLAILLLALVAAIFMVCTGVLGALLWRRARTAHHRLSPTEMVCISSLLPDGDMATNGPKPAPVRRQKLLLDGGSEADGDNLTLSSFLPEHS